MATWSDLPTEIRLQIFEVLVQCSRQNTDIRDHFGKSAAEPICLSDYITVCRQWQQFFEKEIYRRLYLSQSQLGGLSRLAGRQRQLVEYVWLSIDLSKYDCPTCIKFGLPQDHEENNNQYMEAAILTLFQILSTEGDASASFNEDKGLTLEISASSPSDTQHHFISDLYFNTRPDTDWEFDNYRPIMTDIGHGWRDGQRTTPVALASICRLFSCFLSPSFDQQLPLVKTVKHFVIRRQTRANISGRTLNKILQSLPNLESIQFEPWRQNFCYPRDKYIWDKEMYQLTLPAEYQELLSASLPKRVDVFSMFEDFNDDYNTIYCTDDIPTGYPFPPEMTRTPCSVSGPLLAEQSLALRKLFASYFIDASDVFQACKPDWTWPRLTTLALTSNIIVPSTNYEEINSLLVAAGTVALRMPKLMRMEIWNGRKGIAGVFRYLVMPGSASIEWCGTWNLQLDTIVVETWNKVAETNTEYTLSVREPRILDKGVITSHGMAILKLQLADGVVHPVSLEQIRRETGRYWFK